MFMTHLKTALTVAMRRTFDAEYTEPDFRNTNVGIDFPVEREGYPAIWVDFIPTAQLEVAGISHIEVEEGSAGFREHTRWRFQGTASYTALAMTSLERDRLFDEVVRVMAFGREQAQTSEFRTYIEDNEFIAINIDFDQIGVAGINATGGTPWGTDEMIYEATVQLECIGEFVSDGATATLVPLSGIVMLPYNDQEPDPAPTGDWQ
jgi:hypothetical protein